jgi:hypothetical protein
MRNQATQRYGAGNYSRHKFPHSVSTLSFIAKFCFVGGAYERTPTLVLQSCSSYSEVSLQAPRGLLEHVNLRHLPAKVLGVV